MDPNRYSKNRTIRPDSAWKIIQALVTLGLMLCGFIGIAVHLFGSDQGPTDWLQWVTANPINGVIAFILLVAAIAFHRYITHISSQQRRAASDLPVYIMMLVGVYFIYTLITTGHW
jgi:type IV secretory pathway VirB2 component (pilin)